MHNEIPRSRFQQYKRESGTMGRKREHCIDEFSSHEHDAVLCTIVLVKCEKN